MEFKIRRVHIEEATIEADSEEEAMIRLKYGLPDYIAWQDVENEIQLITDNGDNNNGNGQ